MIIIKLIISPKEKQKCSFLTCFRWEMNISYQFSFLISFRVEMDISYNFHKMRLKCEIFSPTFPREKGPISCLSGTPVISPRIDSTPSKVAIPFDMTRRQFPVRLGYAMTINKS